MNETAFELGEVFSAVQRRGIKPYVLRDQHHAGFGPGTVEKHGELWEKAGGAEIGKLKLMKMNEIHPGATALLSLGAASLL